MSSRGTYPEERESESVDEYSLFLRNSYLAVDDLKLDHLHGELSGPCDL